MIFGLILNTSWNANLKSYLTTKKINMPFDSLQKLLKATNYKVAVQAESTQESNFKLSSDPIKQKIFTDRIKIYPKISAAIPWVYPDNALYALKEIL